MVSDNNKREGKCNCRVCRVECSKAHFMCDRDPDGVVYCQDCFPETDCGKELHGEGCPTAVFSDE